MATKILKKIPEQFQNISKQLYIFQQHVSSSKVSKIYVLVIPRLGALNEYQIQNNININKNINTCRTISKISLATPIFYVNKDLSRCKRKILTYLEQNKLLYL